MVKKKIKKHNSRLYDEGGLLGGIGGAISGISSVVDSAKDITNLRNKDTIQNQIDAQGSYISTSQSNDDLMKEFSTYQDINTDITADDVLGTNQYQRMGKIWGATGKGALSGTTPLGMFLGAGLGAAVGGISTAIAERKAEKEAKRLSQLAEQANARRWSAMTNQAGNIDAQNDMNLLYNYSAMGGPIHIKKANRGKFTESAKRAGMGVQEYARHILANPEDYSSTLRKRANFARNAAKWHAFGGELFSNGMNIDDGVYIIGNGGSHEMNPNNGVQIGVDQEGIPNLVEEGEVIWNDYVFSNRLKTTEKMKEDLKLTGDTFADMAKNAMKESEERPNDPISIRGRDATLKRLAVAQEEMRNDKEGNTFAEGGNLFYDGSLIDKDFNKRMEAFESKLGIQNPSGFDVDGDFLGVPITDANKALSEYKTLHPAFKGLDIPTDDLGMVFDPITKQRRPSYVKEGQYYFKHPSSAGKDKGLPTSTTTKTKDSKFKDSYLRYAPVIGSMVGVLNDIAGGSDPDFTTADIIEQEAKRAGQYLPVAFAPIGDRLSYNPFDREYAQNRLNAQAAATRRSILNTSGGNRAQALAGLLASDYNAQTRSGELARQAEEFNRAEKARVADFNRRTNMYNAEGLMKAAMANQAAKHAADTTRLQGISEAMRIRNMLKEQSDITKSGNLSSLFTNIGNVGIDSLNREERNMLIKNGVLGNYSYEDLRGAGFTKAEAIEHLRKQGWTDDDLRKAGLFACGGKIKRRKRGLTY